MDQAYRDIAQRGVNAHANFEALPDESKRVTSLYLKERIAKIDYVLGRINVQHGAFLDAAVIRRAAKG